MLQFKLDFLHLDGHLDFRVGEVSLLVHVQFALDAQAEQILCLLCAGTLVFTLDQAVHHLDCFILVVVQRELRLLRAVPINAEVAEIKYLFDRNRLVLFKSSVYEHAIPGLVHSMRFDLVQCYAP